MKKLRVSLMALALTAGVAGAFANQMVHQFKVHDPSDLYQDTDASGNLIPTSAGGHVYADQAAATLATGCTTGSNFCAASVSAPDGTKTGTAIKKN